MCTCPAHQTGFIFQLTVVISILAYNLIVGDKEINRFIITLSALLLSFSSLSLGDAAKSWNFIGPGKLPVQQIVNDRNHPNIWFVLIDSLIDSKRANLFRSTNGGQTWNAAFQIPVGNVLIHPRTSEVFVTASESDTYNDNGLWKSSDQGKTFSRIADFPFSSSTQIFFDPLISRNLYAIDPDSGNVLISRDEGKNWESISLLPKRQKECTFTSWYFNDLLISPFNHNDLYGTATTSCTRSPRQPVEFLLESKDRGLNWGVIEQLPRGRDRNFNTRFHSDPAFSNRAFLYGDNGLRILTHTGWSLISSLPGFSRLVSVPGDPLHLYSTDSGWLSESHDGGSSWEKVEGNLNGNVWSIQSRMDGTLIAGNAMGIYHLNSADEWRPKNFGLPRHRGHFKIDVAASDDSTLFATIDTANSLYRKSNNRGLLNLTGRYQLSGRRAFTSVGVSQRNSAHVVLFDGIIALFSTDGGKHWSQSSLAVQPDAYPYVSLSPPVFDPQNENVVYLIFDQTILKSRDAGATFERLPISGRFGFYRLLIDEWDSNVLFLTFQYGGGIYKSVDGGQTLQRADFGLPVWRIAALASLPIRNAYIAVTFTGTIYGSNDGGANWTKLAKVDTDRPPDPESCRFQGVCLVESISAETGKHWFVVTRGSGDIYETMDAGNSWTRINDRFQQALVSEITDPRRKPFYAATNIGLFESPK